jgi:hypothetical protein
MAVSKNKFFVLSAIAVAGLAFGAIWAFRVYVDTARQEATIAAEREKSRKLAACIKHVRGAERQAAQALSRRTATFASFIESRKVGAKPFSKEIVSLYGKWRVIKDKLPWTDTDGHRKYVEEEFSKNVFSSDEMASAVRQAVVGGLKDLESIENNLAVALRKEVLGRSLTPQESPVAIDEFKKSIDQLVKASQVDVVKSGGSLVASEVASLVGRQILIRLGVSAGILTTAAANSWWTLGASVLIGLIVDVMWEWIDDPAGDIEREVMRSLDGLSSKATQAITTEMNGIIATRSLYWTQTVEVMLK